MRTIASLLLLGLACAASSCGGSPAKARLHAYESAMEVLMAEDGRVSASLSDLKEDLFADNARSEDQARYTRETAGPFFARFRTAAIAVPTEDPRLDEIHGTLLRYIDRRVQYLAAIEVCLTTAESEPMRKLLQATLAVGQARQTLQEKTGGKIDREAADAATTVRLFSERVLAAFGEGRVERSFVEKAMVEQVIPRLLKVGSRPLTGGTEPSDLVDQAVVAWAREEISFFQVQGAALPVQEKAQQALRDTEEHWSAAEELRSGYLGDLTAYRESIR